MVLFNYSTKELTAKIVYYGPGLCGKTTNLQYIHANLPGNIKGKMLSLATKTDRTLFFDFLPLDLGMIRGMKTRVQLYTVPGQVFYNETRKLVLKGADGIVFVADSQETMAGANVEAFKNLEENLRAHGLNLSEMPHVIQFNKRDLPRLSGIEEMNSAINRFNAPFYESVATSGIGVQDTLKAITKLVLLNLTQKYDPRTGKKATPDKVEPAVPTPSPAAGPGISMPVPEAPADSPGLPLSATDPGISLPESGLPLSVSEPAVEEKALPPSMTLPEPPDFSIAGVGPSDRASFADADQDTTPDFADSDIDDLVGEVGEREFSASPSIEEPEPEVEVFDLGEEPGEIEADPIQLEAESLDVPESIPVEMSPLDAEPPELESIPFDPPAPTPTVVAPEPSFPSVADLQVDRNFDPDWKTEPLTSSLPDPPAEDGPLDLPSVETFDIPDQTPEPPSGPDQIEWNPEQEAADTPDEVEIVEAAEETVRLTDVVEDNTLFADPGLDIVKLAAGGVTEIVLPVELGTGAERKRFKLSLNLRLDHVE